MMKEQRRAIILGATSGIGLEVAKVYRCCKDTNFFEEKAGSLNFYL